MKSSNSLSRMGDRVAAANAEALRRHYRQRSQFAPFRLAVVVAVLVVAFTSKPIANFSGRGLAIILCLGIFCVGVVLFPSSERNVKRS